MLRHGRGKLEATTTTLKIRQRVTRGPQNGGKTSRCSRFFCGFLVRIFQVGLWDGWFNVKSDAVASDATHFLTASFEASKHSKHEYENNRCDSSMQHAYASKV